MELRIEDWIVDNNLPVEHWEDNILRLKDVEKVFFVLSYKPVLFDEDSFLILSHEEYDIADKVEDKKTFNFLFQFGAKWYYCPWKTSPSEDGEDRYKIALNEFLYLGEAEVSKKYDTFLGIHTEYEILNSALNIKTAIKKAKFLGASSLGMCDKGTLGGSLAFQLECKKNGLKPIIGQTMTIAYDYSEDKDNQLIHDIKLICLNEEGWFNLLNMNKKISTDYEGKFLPESYLLNHAAGLICIFDYSNSVLKGVTDEKKYEKIIKRYGKNFESIHYQFSSVEYSSDSFDLACLNSFKFYFNNFRGDDFSTILIEDAYYLEPNQSDCKDSVNAISKKAYQHSFEQHFKNLDETENKIDPYFADQEITARQFISEANEVANNIAKDYSFEIPLDGAKLPRFEDEGEMVPEEESKGLLRLLCEEGFDEKIRTKVSNPEKLKEYRDRLEKEYDVIAGAGFADYFLILWDTVNFAISNDVMIGTGRGSVGGSLLAYLIGITRIDPIKYDLLFERFLNEARFKKQYKHIIKSGGDTVEIKDGETFKVHDLELTAEELDQVDPTEIGVDSIEKVEDKRMDSLPDIDLDFTTASRDDIKDYLKNKYGENFTCSVGTYGRLKLRQTFKDLAKIEGVKFAEANELTKKIEDQHEYEFFDLFKYAKKDSLLYNFLQKNPEMIERLEVVLNNPKSISVHPSAVLVLPKEDHLGRERSLDDWIPIRSINGLNVSEWEGKYCDIFGLLKNDILGLAQLDKFTYCLRLIKENKGIDIDLDEIPLDDVRTFKRFKYGFNEDVFQFGSRGLKAYSKEVKPDHIDDLIAMAALYRPGPMSSDAHTDYAKIKHGLKDPEYDFGLKVVTEETNGLYIYQEQIMKAVVVLGGFSLVKADSLRTAIKKFDAKVMKSFEESFIAGAIKNNCPPDEATAIWKKLLAFSGYGFNKSHSAAYALIAYQSQWLKSNYPLEFWTTAMNFGKEDVDIPYYISEIQDIKSVFKKSTKVSIASADINNSTQNFECNGETNEINWSMVKVKGVAETSANKILAHRDRLGKFESLEQFLEEVPRKDANKTVMTNLIIAGAFDKICNIGQTWERAEILLEFYDARKIDAEVCKYLTSDNIGKSWQWKIWEKSLTGFGDIEYPRLLEQSDVSRKISSKYISSEDFERSDLGAIKAFDFKSGTEVAVCGIIKKVDVRTARNKKNYLLFFVESNSRDIPCVIWFDSFDKESDKVINNVGKMVIVLGAGNRWASRNGVYVYNSKCKIELI